MNRGTVDWWSEYDVDGIKDGDIMMAGDIDAVVKLRPRQYYCIICHVQGRFSPPTLDS
jgi:hypothetical protein